MSRNLRLIFTVTTMLGAVAVAPIASAGTPNWAKQAVAAKKAGFIKIKIPPKVNWAQQAIAAKKAGFIKIPPKVNGPVFIPPGKVKVVPVFIPGRPTVIVRGGGNAPAYSTSYASTPSQSQPAPAATYQALGLAWNNDGAWVVEQAATLDEAGANALTKCNAQYGSCQLSTSSVSEQSFACLGVARGAENAHRLFASKAGSQDAMQANVLRSMSDAGTSGNFEYAACNAASSS